MGDPVEIKYKVEWWERMSMAGGICDYCSGKLDEFPAAVLMYNSGENPYALCKKCRLNSAIKPGDNEYFETLAMQTRDELPVAGKNFGGRRSSA